MSKALVSCAERVAPSLGNPSQTLHHAAPQLFTPGQQVDGAHECERIHGASHAAHTCSNASTTSAPSCMHAMCSGVAPVSLRTSTGTPAARSDLTAVTWELVAAAWSNEKAR